MNLESIGAAFLVGLLGGTHCVGMCGGIVGALSAGLSPDVRSARGASCCSAAGLQQRAHQQLCRCRLCCWAVRATAGDGGGLQGIPVGRIVGGVIMILLGVYLAGWWHSLLFLERAGAHVWKYIEPLGRRFIPVRGVRQAYLLGLVWGWLPCGMVYAVLALALARVQRGRRRRDHAGVRAGHPADHADHGAGLYGLGRLCRTRGCGSSPVSW